jgi:hypothetical protein
VLATTGFVLVQACRRPSHPASATRSLFLLRRPHLPRSCAAARGGGADPSSGCRHPRVVRLATYGRGRFTMTDEELAEVRAKVPANDQRRWLPTGGAR